MSLPISSSPSSYFKPSFLNLSPAPTTIQRIKEIAGTIFLRLSEFLKSFQAPASNEGNLKTFALVSCLSLIALLVLSILRRRDPNLVLMRRVKSSRRPNNTMN